MPRALLVALCALSLTACQVTPNVKELQDKNTELQSELALARTRIQNLQASEIRLSDRVDELEQVVSVLREEKASRVEESSELRLQVRKFVQGEIDEFKQFLMLGNLLDYVGGELVERGAMNVEPLTLVDFAHPIPRAGSLTGVAGYFAQPTDLTLRVLRPVEDKYVVIWQSELLTIAQAGETQVSLPVSVGVEEGDIIAYSFPSSTNVSFDRGTGATRYTKRDLALGTTISSSSLSGEDEKRAYSLGVLALLE